ncbi:hypothetical protein [Chelativorans sp. YIM 93263]|nr:hypothetical protein [Chelativorans sp. YIM 93263]
MKPLMQTPGADEPFSITGLLTDLAALAAVGAFVAVACAFIMGAF